MKRNFSEQKGFTLIELMITVAIVAILASIAYPSYKEYVAKSRRAEARSVLMAAQQWMERFYSENYRYDQNSAGVAVTDASQFPRYFSVSPVPGQGAAMYDITLAVTPGVRDSYALRAVRRAGTFMAADRCGDYVLDQYQRRKLENFSTTVFSSQAAALEYCWR